MHTRLLMTQCIHETQAICSIYHVCKHTTQYLSKYIHKPAYRSKATFPLYDLWHITHTSTHHSGHTGIPRAYTGYLQYFLYWVYCVQLSAGCQYVQLPSKQPHLLQIIKYAFKMSLGLERAKAEATNRCTLVVQLTLAWTPTLLFPLSFFLWVFPSCLSLCLSTWLLHSPLLVTCFSILCFPFKRSLISPPALPLLSSLSPLLYFLSQLI